MLWTKYLSDIRIVNSNTRSGGYFFWKSKEKVSRSAVCTGNILSVIVHIELVQKQNRRRIKQLINGELLVDNFAGGGGASTGIEMATG